MRNFRVRKRDQLPAVVIKPVIATPIDPFTARLNWARQLREAATNTELSALRERNKELEHKIWELTHQPQLQAMYNLQANQNAMLSQGYSLGLQTR
jgi:hypothetical protein